MPHAKWHGIPVSDDEWWKLDNLRWNRNNQDPDVGPRLRRGEKVSDEEMDYSPDDVPPQADPGDGSGQSPPLVAGGNFESLKRLMNS